MKFGDSSMCCSEQIHDLKIEYIHDTKELWTIILATDFQYLKPQWFTYWEFWGL